MSTHCGPLIYKNYNIVAAESGYNSAIGDSCLLHAFLPPKQLHTRARVPHSALLVPPVSMASAPLWPNSSSILDSDPYRDHGLYILYTIFLHALLARVPYPTSNSASPNVGSVVVCGFVGLPTLDPISVFHATSLPFPILLPRLRASFVTVSSSGLESKMPRTTRSGTHLSVSYYLADHTFQPLI